MINRYGFNSSGLSTVKSNLVKSYEGLDFVKKYHDLGDDEVGIIGVNFGKNTQSSDATADYVKGIKTLGPLSSYIVINVSCPNIKNVTKLQSDLKPLLEECSKARDEVCKEKMMFVKVGPDLSEGEHREAKRRCVGRFVIDIVEIYS